MQHTTSLIPRPVMLKVALVKTGPPGPFLATKSGPPGPLLAAKSGPLVSKRGPPPPPPPPQSTFGNQKWTWWATFGCQKWTGGGGGGGGGQSWLPKSGPKINIIQYTVYSHDIYSL